jgi:hypothetical protein
VQGTFRMFLPAHHPFQRKRQGIVFQLHKMLLKRYKMLLMSY